MRYFLISLLAVISIVGHARADKGAAVSGKHITPKMLHGKVAYIQGDKLKCMNSDGSDKHTILSNTNGMRDIRFSPDLTHIVYSYARPNDDPYLGTELFSMKIDGSEKHQLTQNEYKNVLQHPQYSPDGKRIVYARWSGKHWGGPMTASADIWIVNADGSDNHRLIGDYLKFEKGSAYSKPYWSKDGKCILCFRTKGAFPESPDYKAEPSVPTIVSMDGIEKPATPDFEAEYLLDDVSRNGEKSIVTAKTGKILNDAVLYIVDHRADSKKQLAVLSNSDILTKFFSPNEKFIIFTQLEWGDPQAKRIWRVDVDGKNLKCLVQGKNEFASAIQCLAYSGISVE